MEHQRRLHQRDRRRRHQHHVLPLLLRRHLPGSARQAAKRAETVRRRDWRRPLRGAPPALRFLDDGDICGARHLANRGAQVCLCLVSPDRLGTAATWQRHIFQATPGRETDIQSLFSSNEPVDIIIDALIGYGLGKAPRGNALRLIQWANGAGTPILALDIPSGVNATTGETPGEHIKARWTLTLALPKTGLLPEHTGDLILADIGIPPGVYAWETLKLLYTPPFGDRFLVPLTITSV